MRQIVMFIHEENGVYGASFPDFPGATTVAPDIDRLLPKAAEMLAFHVAGIIAAGDHLPSPRSLAEIRQDPLLAAEIQGAVLALVRVPPYSGEVWLPFVPGSSDHCDILWIHAEGWSAPRLASRLVDSRWYFQDGSFEEVAPDRLGHPLVCCSPSAPQAPFTFQPIEQVAA